MYKKLHTRELADVGLLYEVCAANDTYMRDSVIASLCGISEPDMLRVHNAVLSLFEQLEQEAKTKKLKDKQDKKDAKKEKKRQERERKELQKVKRQQKQTQKEQQLQSVPLKQTRSRKLVDQAQKLALEEQQARDDDNLDEAQDEDMDDGHKPTEQKECSRPSEPKH